MPLLSRAVATLRTAGLIVDVDSPEYCKLRLPSDTVASVVLTAEDDEITEITASSSEMGSVKLPIVIKNIVPVLTKMSAKITLDEASTANREKILKVLALEDQIDALYKVRSQAMTDMLKDVPLNVQVQINQIESASIRDKFADKHVAFKATAMERFEIIKKLNI